MAAEAVEGASLVAVSLHALCELVWVLDRSYGVGRQDISHAIRLLIAADTVALDRQAVEAGLAILDRGGDFADGVIAFEGRSLGGEVFATFDRKAARLLDEQGLKTEVLG